VARSARCREKRNVCGRCEVNGAPRRIVRMARSGVVRARESVREKMSCWVWS